MTVRACRFMLPSSWCNGTEGTVMEEKKVNPPSASARFYISGHTDLYHVLKLIKLNHMCTKRHIKLRYCHYYSNQQKQKIEKTVRKAESIPRAHTTNISSIKSWLFYKLSVSHMIVEEFWPLFFELCRCLFLQSLQVS